MENEMHKLQGNFFFETRFLLWSFFKIFWSVDKLSTIIKYKEAFQSPSLVQT